jgi:single-strand DNA-binding protein
MYQQIILIGNLGNDPEMRYTPGGKAVASFSLAVNSRKDHTVWFRVSMWEKQAEIVSQYLTKGSKVMVIGEIEEARPWTDRDGKQRASLEVTGRTIKFLSTSADGKMQSEPVVDSVESDVPF